MFALRRLIVNARFCSKAACPPITVCKAFTKECIVPDVLDEVPEDIPMATMSFTSGVSAYLGNVLTPTEVRKPPTLTWIAENDCFYTICMTDPDAPCRDKPDDREWHHWLVANVPGLKVCEGEVLSEYIGAAPPKDTGFHRYVLLVYRQPDKLCFTDYPHLTDKSADCRANFSIKTFACDFKLEEPIAGNYFLAEYDCYVLVINDQLNPSCG